MDIKYELNVDTTGYRQEDINYLEEDTKRRVIHHILEDVKKHIILKHERIGPTYIRYSGSVFVRDKNDLPPHSGGWGIGGDFLERKDYKNLEGKLASVQKELKTLQESLKDEKWLGPKDVSSIKKRLDEVVLHCLHPQI